MLLYYQKDVCEPCEGDLLKLQRFFHSIYIF